LLSMKRRIEHDEMSWEMSREKQQFKSDLIDILRGKRDFIYSGKPLKAVPADALRILTETKRDGAVFTTLRNLIINGFVSSEERSAGAGLAFLIDVLEGFSGEEILLKRFGAKELEKALHFYLGDGMVMEACMTVFDSVGHDSTVSFDVSHHDDRLTVKLKPSFGIKGSLHDLFVPNSHRVLGARALCIDGILESASNVENLMRSVSERKQPVVLIAKGYDADLINTLRFNHKKNAMQVYPFVVSADCKFEDLGSLGMDVIDVETFFRLNVIKYDDLKFQSDFLFDHEKMEVALDCKSSGKTVEIMIPKRLMSISGIIEDRLLSGLCFCKDATFHGLNQFDDGVMLPNQSVRFGRLANRALQNQLKRLASIIYVE